MTAHPGIGAVTRRIQAEYTHNRGLRLTPWQIERLCCLDATQSDAAIRALVHARFLRMVRDGSFVRRVEPR